jgi:hypothetical protein
MKTTITLFILFITISLGLFAQSVAISPNKAVAGQTFAVTISGKSTSFLTGINTVNFIQNSTITSDVIFTNQKVVNDSLITGTVTILSTVNAPNYFPLRISNTINPPINISGGITIIDTDTIIPRLYKGIIFGNINQGTNKNITIRGKNTHFETAQNIIVKVYKYGIESKSIAVSNIRAIKYPSPDAGSLSLDVFVDIQTKIGAYSLSVENEIDGKLLLDNAFTVINPNQKSISFYLLSGNRNKTVNATIKGSKTNFQGMVNYFHFTKSSVISQDLEISNFLATTEFDATFDIKIKPLAELGNYDLVYTNSVDEDTIIVKNVFTVYQGVGTNEISENTTKIYPNPAKNILNIESKKNITSIHIFDITGKEILNKIPEKQTQNLQLNLTEILIPQGFYFIKVQSLEGMVTKKIVVE